MPSFQYRGRNNAGELVTGRIQAATADAAAADLWGDSITPIEISELKGRSPGREKKAAKPGVASSALAWTSSRRVEIDDLIVFSRQMYRLSKAGLPLDRALKGLEASISSLPMKRVLRDVAAQLEKGTSLTDALSRHPKAFSPLYLSLIHVGENTGRLDLAFEQVGKYLLLEQNTRKQIKSATRYPIFVVVAITVALAVITVFVIPVFADTFERLQAELPWQTRVLIGVSEFVSTNWIYILGGIAGAFLAFRAWITTDQGLRKWDRNKLRAPIIGGIFKRVALSRFSRTFAMMMRAGVPVVQSLGVIARAVGNRYIGDNVLKMQDGLARGESLYQTSVKSGMFSPLVLQMIAVGEESGAVDELLEEVAEFYDSEVEYDLKRLGSVIEPILIVMIAGMVLVLALGVFLPIWDLMNAAR